MNALDNNENMENQLISPGRSPNPFKTFRHSPLRESMRLSPNRSPMKSIHVTTKKQTPRSGKKYNSSSPIAITPTKNAIQPLSPIFVGSPDFRMRTPKRAKAQDKKVEDIEIEIVLPEDDHSPLDIANPLDSPAAILLSPQSKQDMYGFVNHEDSSRVYVNELSEDEENVKFWTEWLTNPVSNESLDTHVMKFGVPHDLRTRTWPLLLGVREFKESQSFQYPELRSKGRHDVWARQIDLDLHRTYSSHTHFLSPSSRGQKAMSNVLNAYAHFNEDIGYCQGMGFLAGLLLMNMDEESTFWAFATMLDRCGMLDYYIPTMTGLLNDSNRLNQMIQIENPSVYYLFVCIHRGFKMIIDLL